MSETLKNIRINVLAMFGDTQTSNAAFSRQRVDLAIRRNYQLLSLDIPTPYTETVSAITLSADVSDYTLPTAASVEYKSILYLKLVSLGWTLQKLSMPEMTLIRLRNLARGRPQYWTGWEDSSQQVNIRVYPTPNSGVLPDTIDVFTSSVGLDLSADTDAVPWQKPAVRLLELSAAIDLLSSASDGQIGMLMADRGVIPVWQAMVSKGLKDEKRRHGNIVNQRRVRQVVR